MVLDDSVTESLEEELKPELERLLEIKNVLPEMGTVSKIQRL